LLLPIIVPTVITSIAMYFLSARLHLVGNLLWIGICHAVIALPVVLLILLAALQGVDVNLERAALSLGARRARADLRRAVRLSHLVRRADHLAVPHRRPRTDPAGAHLEQSAPGDRADDRRRQRVPDRHHRAGAAARQLAARPAGGHHGRTTLRGMDDDARTAWGDRAWRRGGGAVHRALSATRRRRGRGDRSAGAGGRRVVRQRRAAQ